jgi:hypothetical protein
MVQWTNRKARVSEKKVVQGTHMSLVLCNTNILDSSLLWPTTTIIYVS